MILEYVVLGIYFIALVLILLYALAQLNLLINYITARNTQKEGLKFNLSNPNEVPFVTIQLPVFNEMYVMERLLNNISKIEYPNEKLEIQVLDDSTDESLELTRSHITRLQKEGLNIKHVLRKDRTDFKAGALREGLKTATGEFIAIFDADFLPDSDWLLKTVPHFKDQNIGVVQTRWGHLNREYSLLTKVQAFALDAHFTLEQTGRNSRSHFINFNGTAGIWRKTCIEDAGNWKGDTLTEDLDLSYRAQLKDWKFKYLEEVITPAELPVVISAARTQQFRWNKGGAQNFRKMLWSIIKNKNVPFKTKLHGLLHLLNSTMFLNVLIVAVLSIPVLYIKNAHPELNMYFTAMSLFIVSTLIFFICYWVMYRNTFGNGLISFINYVGLFFTFFSIAMGFSLHNSIAVIEGHIGKQSAFIRTPKFNIKGINGNWKRNKYLRKHLSKNVILEGLLTLYFLFGIYSAFVVSQSGDYGFLPFHIMLVLGFGYVFVNSIRAKV